MAKPAKWKVTKDGMVGPDDYFIQKGRLDETRNGLCSEWIAHLVEKTWFDLDLFIPAFREALQRHKVKHDFDLDLSIYLARRKLARSELLNALRKRLFPSDDELRAIRASDLANEYFKAEEEMQRLLQEHEDKSKQPA